MGICLSFTKKACGIDSGEFVTAQTADEFRSGVGYHTDYVARDTGAQVKEAYFPLECVPGDFRFQVVLKFAWQNEQNILYYKNDLKNY